MRRREFINLLGGSAIAWPHVARAQNSGKAPRRIAFFPDLNPVSLGFWRADMLALGWIEGHNFVVQPSGIEYGSRPPLMEDAERIVAGKPDLIFTQFSNYAITVQRATSIIPIVMLTSGYPVEAGLAKSLARPGENVTGNTIYAETGVWGKLLQLLYEAKPGIKRVGILWTYVVPAFPKEEIEPGYAELYSAARELDLELHFVTVDHSDRIQDAIDEIKQWSPDGLLLTSFLSPKARSALTQFASDNALPTVADSDWTRLVSPHALLCFGALYRELIQNAVASVDKVLRGARPGDVPIQRPNRFELVVSLKTAKTIGLDLSPVLLAQANRIVE